MRVKSKTQQESEVTCSGVKEGARDGMQFTKVNCCVANLVLLQLLEKFELSPILIPVKTLLQDPSLIAIELAQKMII